jgi:hypothetical protein
MKHYVDSEKEVGMYGPGQYVYRCENGIQKFKCVTYTGEKTLVEQSAAIETDLNRLLEPAIRQGLLRHSIKFEGEYDDIPVQTFEDAQIVIANAKSMYEELPSAIRKNFDGPKGFLEFVNNPDNKDQMESMGILKGNDGITRTGAPSGAPTAAQVPQPTTPPEPTQAEPLAQSQEAQSQ